MKIGFIGGGNMAGAMIGGMLKRGYGAGDIGVAEPSAERRSTLATEFGVFLEASAATVLASDLLILAVKPQVLRAVLASLPRLAQTTCVLSIAAGVRAGDIARWLQGHGAVVRAMPNTPALVGAGIAGLYALPGVSIEQKARAEQALKAVGQVVWVADEAMIDAVTAISGSGPAYVFLFIEALEAAALELGFAPGAARMLALHTVYGSAALALQDGADPAVLRARVTSKGGTTERGIAALEAHGLPRAVLAAARAAAARAKELGELLGAE
ncbi:MAG: pyrroline-5-carboxylate reductase [Hydrogenophilales bacterium CG03_land_8_20_14_0_80_62_28]|nr:pyrroline-5-carboxylate reductase [Betaproteobacteria bacterium]PIV24011.1 MAG: pyrroline-5-carboxylate reductase [Hydrogenophilales bacterium CG03_land_8_20_14_0_80_62_28]PIW39237.1 MAG: pyrroline-5-carboxylate reductase [Hydrogenophilales bacterium CG15_BIG_FIL_POST_REV_8_21_14_020_62_31]PIW71955.1 MAG: pyrroline-5-carboxylate reductase [Hydrogenophilales bacterium CG12_big_fil_rev_8_21_14_0_65_61_21]PIX01311.1 MAG: pyrroline-5-carboxylate reductase [Hydrogenophilales bacterium CG_4_8_14_3